MPTSAGASPFDDLEASLIEASNAAEEGRPCRSGNPDPQMQAAAVLRHQLARSLGRDRPPAGFYKEVLGECGLECPSEREKGLLMVLDDVDTEETGRTLTVAHREDLRTIDCSNTRVVPARSIICNSRGEGFQLFRRRWLAVMLERDKLVWCLGTSYVIDRGDIHPWLDWTRYNWYSPADDTAIAALMQQVLAQTAVGCHMFVGSHFQRFDVIPPSAQSTIPAGGDSTDTLPRMSGAAIRAILATHPDAVASSHCRPCLDHRRWLGLKMAPDNGQDNRHA